MYYTDSLEGLIDPPDDAWKPVYWTERKYEETLGDKIIEFVEKYLSPPRYKGCEPFKLGEWQKWLYRHMYELKPDGTFRYSEIFIEIPRKNGKSMIASHSINYFSVKAENGEEFYIAAKDAQQAEIVFREITKNINNSKALSLVLDPRRDVIKHKYRNAFVKKLSSNSKSTFGFAPYISIGDELWAWDSEMGVSTKGAEMIASLTTGSGDRDEAMFIGITTAGTNVEGLAYQRYEKGKMIATGELEDEAFGFFCWEAEEFDDISDPKTWLKANPSLVEGIMPMNKFEEAYRSAVAFGTADFERYRLNKWIKQSASENYILPYYWREAEVYDLDSIPLGNAITVGFDGSLTEDSTGIVAIDIETGLMEVLYKWEKDPTNDSWYVDVQEVKDAMDMVFEKYDVKKVYADPSRHQDVVKEWIRKHGKNIVRDIPPNAKRMVPMGDEFRQDLYNKTIVHNGNKRFTQHVLNAVENQRGLPAKEKRNSPNKIDFLVCAILANGARREFIESSDRQAIKKRLYSK